MPRPKQEKPEPHLVRVPGRRKWYVSWTESGRTKIKSTGHEDEGLANEWLDGWKIAINSLEDDPKISDILDKYVDGRKGHVLDHDRLRNGAKALKSTIGSKRASMLTLEDIKAHTARGAAPGTIRKELSLLQTAARNAGIELVDFHLPPKPPPRDRFMTKAEADNLMKACKPYHLKLAVRMCLATGCRVGAVLGLKWDQVDFGRKIIDFNEPGRQITKKRRAVVPIGPSLIAHLQDAHAIAQSEFVIEFRGKRIKKIKKAFNTAKDLAGLSWVTPHHMKHTAISWMAEAGYSVDQISDYTETDPETVRRIYRKINPDSLRDMADTMDSFLTTPFAKTPGHMSKTAEMRKGKRRKTGTSVQ